MTNYDQRQLQIQKLEHTRDHEDCPACAGPRALLHEKLTADLTFPSAFKLWLEHRTIESNGVATDASYLSPKSISDYKCCALALEKFFGTMTLGQVHPGHLRAYQQARAVCDKSAGDWARPCGANRIRKEVTLLIRILKAAGRWGEAETSNFTPLRSMEVDVPRAMTPEEQHRFLHLASGREDWQFIYWYSVVALQTTASTNELRALRMGDILLRDGVIQIRRAGAKNKYRMRTIPLVTPDVAWALERLVARAKDLGSYLPSHYLFPFRIKTNTYEPTRPMCDSGLKKRWEQVRIAANMPWLRPYDLRHTAITRMAEAGTPIHVIMAMAGHMTLRMQQHYTTVSMMAKRGWAEVTWGKDSPTGPPKGRAVISYGKESPVDDAPARPWLESRPARQQMVGGR